MHPPDVEKASFITERGVYCYKVMPFGLKNVGATYQRLVNKMFKEIIERTMEVYIDDESLHEALLAGLRVASKLGVEFLDAFNDSQLVVNQVQRDYLAKDLQMVAYLDKVKAMSTNIKDFKIHQIPREENKKSDALANLASTFEFISDRSIPMEFLPSCQIAADPTWMDDIIAYL